MSQVPATTTQKKDIRSLIQSDAVKSQMAMVLPKHLTPDRMARVACTAILKTPKLAQCKPESLLQALMLCSQAGLEPDGRNAHLIPYGDIVQVIFDWKGLVALARENGVKNISADVICENDTFEWRREADGLHFKHEINFRKPRGEMFAAFCIWKDGDQFDGDIMTKAEIDGIRKRSKAGNNGPWVTDYNEMAKKTVIRRASKKWPLDAERMEAVNRDADSVVIETPAARPEFSEAGKKELEDILSPPAVEQQDEPKQEQSAPTPPLKVLENILDEHKVAFDDFRDFVKTQNICKDADSWASITDVPSDVASVIVSNEKTTQKIIKTFGKKS